MRTLRKSMALLLALIMVLAAVPSALAKAAPDADDLNDGLGVWVGGQFVPVEWYVPSSTGEGGAQPMTLLPIEEHNFGLIDLTGFLKAEIKSIKLSDGFWKDDYDVDFGNKTGDIKAVWSVSRDNQSTNDQFRLYDPNEGIDLTAADEEGMIYYFLYLQVIVGEHPEDQFDTSNIRYTFSIRITPDNYNLSEDLLKYELYEPAEKGEDPVGVEILNVSNTRNGRNECVPMLIVGGEQTERDLILKILPDEQEAAKRGLTVDIYDGRFETMEEAEAAPDKKFPEDGIKANFFRYDDQEFTVIFKRGSASQLEHIHVYISKAYISVSFSPFNNISTAEGEFGGDMSCYYTYDIDYIYLDDGTRIDKYTVMLDYGLAADDTYYVRFRAYDSADPYASELSVIERAAAGSEILSQKELEDLADEDDIKDELFNDSPVMAVGHGADYSGGVYFSFLTKYGTVEYCLLQTEEYDGPAPGTELPDAPIPKSRDTYLELKGALKTGNTDDEYSYGYECYAMPYSNDDYYYRGYQTLFMLNRNDHSAVTETKITPDIQTSGNIKLFLGHGAEAAKKVEGEYKAIDVMFGKPVQYSVAAEDGECLKNYWLTFVTRTENGPDLFINGVTNIDDDHRDKQTNEPVREITLDAANRFYHDIFFANIGDKDITDLSVSLDETAQQYISIDEYWSAENETIPAFTDMNEYIGESFYNTMYGELKNVGKVRLIPKDIKSFTNISGYLIFSYTAADGAKEIKVKLTGIAGNPSITTETVPGGVKYVPYDCLIQTNSMGQSDVLSFRLAKDSVLPAGVRLYPNGELYGLPAEPGEYTFAVELTDKAGKYLYDVAEFTLDVADNTDEAVYKASDDGYELKEYVGTQRGDYHFVLDSYSDQTFTSEGTFGEFYALYIDGLPVDESLYSKDEGSTIITIKEQALEDTGSGTHTIAAEFRPDGSTEDGLPKGNVKRTAQNYTIENASFPPAPSTPGTPSTPSTPDKEKDDKPESPSAHDCSSKAFPDLDESKWYHEAVDYVLNQGLFVGYEDGTFRPGGTITRAQSWTIFARLAGVDTTGSDPWYKIGLDWAVKNSISDGTDLGGNASRQEIITMLWRMSGSPASSASLSKFSDAALVSSWSRTAIAWAVENSIILGREDNTIDPRSPTSRAEFAAIIYRYSQIGE